MSVLFPLLCAQTDAGVFPFPNAPAFASLSPSLALLVACLLCADLLPIALIAFLQISGRRATIPPKKSAHRVWHLSRLQCETRYRFQRPGRANKSHLPAPNLEKQVYCDRPVCPNRAIAQMPFPQVLRARVYTFAPADQTAHPAPLPDLFHLCDRLANGIASFSPPAATQQAPISSQQYSFFFPLGGGVKTH